jgi:SHS2 domain-containing protein
VYRFEEHTSEVQVQLESTGLAGLFVEAGRALAELMGAELDAPAEGEQEDVRLAAADRNALLVSWVNELIYRAEVGKKAYTEFRIHSLSERDLHASIRGREDADLSSPVKAATYHGLRITETPAAFSATVVLDV